MKYIFLLMSFISGMASSQNFEFDYLLNYKVTRTEPSEMKFGDTNVYLNSKDTSYTMRSYNIGNQSKIDIEDDNVRLWYKFDVEKKEGASDIYYYDYARKFIDIKPEDKHFVSKVDIEKTGENTYFVKTYQKGKRTNFEIKLEIEKAEADLIFIDVIDISRDVSIKILSEIRKQLGNTHFVIKKAVYDYRTGYVIISELTDVQKVSKKVNVPAEIQERAKMQFNNRPTTEK
ncbi:hypothetical protein [Chryseobacterium defluvii]|uniref:GLPGLI family protein n=1 Tax=Chryseobacterium defluvii TaxID=160396 RepID=A0A495SQJ0_9FLAO|nr:hypothetical protein [Chryseobacterium defluvii]RKT01644.1 hypothetical protein BCF58_0867 [Chryseobacterium defluvii]